MGSCDPSYISDYTQKTEVKNMKKILAFALALLVVAAMASCNKDPDPDKDPTQDPDTPPITDTTPDDNTPETPDGDQGSDEDTPSNPDEDNTPGGDETDLGDGFTLVNEQVYARITVDLRSAPAVDATNVTNKLRYAQVATRIGVSADGEWSKILFEGNEYYVASNCLNAYDPENPPLGSDSNEPIVNPEDIVDPDTGDDQPDAPPAGSDEFVPLEKSETVYVIAEGALNLRAEPNTTSAVVVKLAFGKSLERVATNGSWSKVIYEGKECYAFSEFLTADDIHATGYTELAAPQTMYVTANSLWVRYYPSMIEASIVPYTEHPGLHLGDAVSRVAISPDGSWSRVVINGNTYYVGSAYLSTTAPDGYEDVDVPDYPTGK